MLKLASNLSIPLEGVVYSKSVKRSRLYRLTSVRERFYRKVTQPEGLVSFGSRGDGQGV